MNAQALKGHLDLLVLAILADGAKHGYAVIQSLRSESDEVFDLPEGTVYPVLHRLQKSGYLSSDWVTVRGRQRRVYRITDSGRGALGEQREAWERFSGGVARVLGGVP